ncbi:MAG: cation:proton antiporter [Gammaproteobacteria bacterium]
MEFNGLEIVGGVILLGVAAGRLLGLVRFPSVAGYVVVGVALGESFSGIISHTALEGLHVISELALGAIAFTIGVELEWRTLRKIGRGVLPIVMLEALGAMTLVTACVWLIFDDPPLALVLGSIAGATAPAATVMVIREARAAGPLTSTLLAVVGIDDAIALIMYAAASAGAKAMLAGSATPSFSEVLTSAGHEIGGSLALGVLVGGPLGFIVRKLKSKETVLALAVGALVLIEGISDQMHLSSLLAAMTFGLLMTNIAPFHSRSLGEQIASLAAPILIGFFVLAGAHLRADLLPSLGWLGVIYLVARFAGKLSGAWLGAWIGRTPPEVRNNVGYGLLSQVGIAIGLSLIVSAEFTPLGRSGATLALTVVNVLLGTTLITEVLGPVLARRALVKAGEAGGMDKTRGNS